MGLLGFVCPCHGCPQKSFVGLIWNFSDQQLIVEVMDCVEGNLFDATIPCSAGMADSSSCATLKNSSRVLCRGLVRGVAQSILWCARFVQGSCKEFCRWHFFLSFHVGYSCALNRLLMASRQPDGAWCEREPRCAGDACSFLRGTPPRMASKSS